MKYLFPILLISLLWVSCKPDPKPTEETPAPSSPPEETVEQPVPPGENDGIFETVTLADTVTGNTYKARRPLNPVSTAISETPIEKIDPVKPSYRAPEPQTPQETRVIRALTTNYWIIWALVKIKDPAANLENQGAWFKFNPDGSYEYGYFDKKIGRGAWSFDGQKALLHLDSELLGDDREWSIKIGNTEDVMVWVGTNRYATANIQTKLQNLLFIPKNREEMGYQEK